MNALIPRQENTLQVLSGTLLNPEAKRLDRVNAWLVLLETRARQLIEDEYQECSFEEVQWKALTKEELFTDDPAQLDESKRMWYYDYHMKLYDKITDLSVMVSEDAQGTISRAIQEKKRAMLRWAEIENIQDAKTEIEKTIGLDLGRADHRQMQALLNKDEELEDAGVDAETLTEVFSRKPKFAITAGALVGNVLDDTELTPDEKNKQIKDIMEQAATVQHSTQIKNDHRGIEAQYERVNLENGHIVLNVLCANEANYNHVFRKLAGVLVACEEPLPIIYQSQQEIGKEKGYQDALRALTVVLAICQVGEYEKLHLSTVDKEIVSLFDEYQMLGE